MESEILNYSPKCPSIKFHPHNKNFISILKRMNPTSIEKFFHKKKIWPSNYKIFLPICVTENLDPKFFSKIFEVENIDTIIAQTIDYFDDGKLNNIVHMNIRTSTDFSFYDVSVKYKTTESVRANFDKYYINCAFEQNEQTKKWYKFNSPKK
jgi:hypothetical protein